MRTIGKVRTEVAPTYSVQNCDLSLCYLAIYSADRLRVPDHMGLALERRGGVAPLAILPERSVVHIVLVMARTADRIEDGLSHDRLVVARMTVELAMTARQRKAGLHIMVEARTQPARWIVATGAIATQPVLVECVFVTLLALQRRGLEILALVAIGARDGLVAPHEGKAGSVVIEVGCLLPIGFVVA